MRAYRDGVTACDSAGPPARRLERAARNALLFLGGDPDPPAFSLKDYDDAVFGPFLGVSDEGSAAEAIVEAAHRSPKARVMGSSSVLQIGMALDAERLGAVGETAVGPNEYADIWLACIDRILMTTNVGTRANVRYFKALPVIRLAGENIGAGLDEIERKLAEIFEPFQRTPDGMPRPLIAYVEFDRRSRVSRAAQVRTLSDMKRRLSSGRYCTPSIHRLGLSVRIGRGRRGQKDALRALDIAHEAGIGEVAVAGSVRVKADEAISLPGLLQYLRPGLLGPLLRRAGRYGIRVLARNAADPLTVARSIWSGLSTARSMGFHLGKYGTFPLMLEECEAVIREVQGWYEGWSAAPVFFADQGIVSRERVDVQGDLRRGLETWLRMAHRCGASIVLVDTLDKSSGRRLLRRAKDRTGLLGLRQIAGIVRLARKLGVKVLWAGGITLPQAYELGKLGVFGIYVTSSVAVARPVSGIYRRDPMLASVKEPTFKGVFRAKLLLEAGFLGSRLRERISARRIDGCAKRYMAALSCDGPETDSLERSLGILVEDGWKRHFRSVRARRGRGKGMPAAGSLQERS